MKDNIKLYKHYRLKKLQASVAGDPFRFIHQGQIFPAFWLVLILDPARPPPQESFSETVQQGRCLLTQGFEPVLSGSRTASLLIMPPC